MLLNFLFPLNLLTFIIDVHVFDSFVIKFCRVFSLLSSSAFGVCIELLRPQILEL